MGSNRIVPEEKIKGERLGQLLINALITAGHLQLFAPPHDPNEDHYNGIPEYLVIGKDLFQLENDELEEIVQDYLAKEM